MSELDDKWAAMLQATADYHAELRAIEQTCGHGRATKTYTTYGTFEIKCPDCKQVWTLGTYGYHGSETVTPDSLKNRWREFAERFIRAEWPRE